jgi:hypothetical protein
MTYTLTNTNFNERTNLQTATTSFGELKMSVAELLQGFRSAIPNDFRLGIIDRFNSNPTTGNFSAAFRAIEKIMSSGALTFNADPQMLEQINTSYQTLLAQLGYGSPRGWDTSPIDNSYVPEIGDAVNIRQRYDQLSRSRGRGVDLGGTGMGVTLGGNRRPVNPNTAAYLSELGISDGQLREVERGNRAETEDVIKRSIVIGAKALLSSGMFDGKITGIDGVPLTRDQIKNLSYETMTTDQYHQLREVFLKPFGGGHHINADGTTNRSVEVGLNAILNAYVRSDMQDTKEFKQLLAAFRFVQEYPLGLSSVTAPIGGTVAGGATTVAPRGPAVLDLSGTPWRA